VQDLARRTASARRVRLARQRPRAAQRARTRGHPGRWRPDRQRASATESQLEGITEREERAWITRRSDSDAKGTRENLLRVIAITERLPELIVVPAHDMRVRRTAHAVPTPAALPLTRIESPNLTASRHCSKSTNSSHWQPTHDAGYH